MGYRIRTFSRPRPTSVETTQTTFQSRYLLRPCSRSRELIVGALAKARQLYPARLHAFVFLSNHYHLLATYDDAQQMADFHRHLNSCLALEVGQLHGWQGSVFPRRYGHVELSEEAEVELARLRYVLAQGCKEGLVASPLDWPGASSTEALITGEPLRGVWVDRTGLALARSRGGDVDEGAFEEELELALEPLPGWADRPAEEYRAMVLELVRSIEEETAARHRAEGTRPLGARQVSRMDPWHRPKRVARSPRPWFHARSGEVRQRMRRAWVWIVACYRAAADRWRAGDREVRFPVNTFPPGLPFVKPVELLEPD